MLISKNEVFFLFTIISSYVFGMYLNPPVPFTKKDILRSIDQVAASSATSINDKEKQVIIGFNTNLDAVVNNGASFISSFVGQQVMDKIPSVTSGEIDISQREDLAHVFAHHLKTSSAGERSIVSDALWTDLLGYLEQNEELAEIKVGGNAALMAEAMARSGNIKVFLVGVSGPKVLGRLHSNVVSITGTPQVTILNQRFNTRVDEVHLILEYAANTRFGPFTSQRANRFIVSRDFTNGVLGAADLLNNTAKSADLVVLSGIHLMESLLPSLEAKQERIKQVNQLVASAVHAGARIHLEFASTSDANFTKAIVQQVKYESMGMNEEEFYAICHSLGLCNEANDAALLSKTHTPNVKRLQQVVQEMFRVTPTLNRLHYHSYSYHLIVQRRQSAERWPNAKQAVAAGSLRATLRACLVSQVADLHGNQLLLGVSAFKTATGELKEFTKQDPVVRFEAEGELDFYIVPVVACAVPKQTVGLGDNISAQALTKQL